MINVPKVIYLVFILNGIHAQIIDKFVAITGEPDGKCDFEQDTCGWLTNYRYQRFIRKGAVDSAKLPAGPDRDGSGNSTGHYMIVNAMENTSDYVSHLVNGAINTFSFQRAAQSCRMTFKYYLSADTPTPYLNYTTIESGIVTIDKLIILVHQRIGVTGGQWSTGIVAIGRRDRPFKVWLALRPITHRLNPITAIDDIAFVDCKLPAPTIGHCPGAPDAVKCATNSLCILGHVLCDGVDDCGDGWDESAVNCAHILVKNCTFEAKNISACNLTREPPQHLAPHWVVRYNHNFIFNFKLDMSGPVADHTYGYKRYGSVLLLKARPGDYYQKARIVTPMLTALNGQSCSVRLFYYMVGQQMGSLTLSVRYADPTITAAVKPFAISGNHSQQWLRAWLTNTDYRPFQFVIEGRVGTGLRENIAIDDLSYSAGCRYYTGPIPNHHWWHTMSKHPNPSTTTTIATTIVNTIKPLSVQSAGSIETTVGLHGGLISGIILMTCLTSGVIFWVVMYWRRRSMAGRGDLLTPDVYYTNLGTDICET